MRLGQAELERFPSYRLGVGRPAGSVLAAAARFVFLPFLLEHCD
jgi:hypothetical protein